jgi:aspartate kinase
MINQGASEISMMFGIHVDDAEKAVIHVLRIAFILVFITQVF